VVQNSALCTTGAGPVQIVALHGLGADRRQPLGLLGVGDELTDQNVLAMDLRAHGLCELDASPSTLTISQLATDVESLILSHDMADSVALFGISMGAAIALDLLARGTVPVAQAFIVRPAWHWSANPPNLDVLTHIGNLLARWGSDEGRRRLKASDTFARVAAVSTRAAQALLLQFTDGRALERAARLTAIPASAPRRPQASAAEVTVLAADQDPVHPVHIAEAVAADLNARLVEVPPRYDQPEEHLRRVRAVVVETLRSP
jgi:pimeloyl-ACP methyl ester carboxylesterase